MKIQWKCTLTVVASLALAGSLGCNSNNPFPGQGVTHDYGSYVPDTAAKVAEGTGSVSYKATGQGTVYVVDTNRQVQTTEKTSVPYVVGTYLVLGGQTLSVDGSAKTISVSGNNAVQPATFTSKRLTADAGFQLYFEPKAPPKKW